MQNRNTYILEKKKKKKLTKKLKKRINADINYFLRGISQKCDGNALRFADHNVQGHVIRSL